MADLDRLDIAAGIDTSGLDAGLQQQLRLIDRFADSLAQANRTFPPITIGLDSSAVDRGLAETRAKFDRVIKETRDLAKFPDLTTEAQQREISELAKEYTGLDTAIRRIDPSGILGGVAGQARAAAQAIEAVIAKRQQAEAPLKLSVDTAGLTASMEGAVLAVKGSTAQIHALLEQTFLDEQKIGQVVPGSIAPSVVVAQQNPEAARLAQAVADEAATTARAAEAMDRLTAADAQQALAAAQAGAASQLAARQIEAQGRAALLAAGQQTQAQRIQAAARGGGGGGGGFPPSGIREVIGQQEQVAASAEQAAAAERKLADAIAAASTTGGSLARGFAVASAQVRSGNLALTEGAVAAEAHAIGTSRAVNAISALAATSVSAQGPLGRLAETALLFSGGEIAVVGVAAAVLALVNVYRFLTTAEREAAAEHEKLVQGLLQEANSAVPAAERAALGLVAALAAEEEAARKLRVEQSLREVARGQLPGIGPAVPLQATGNPLVDESTRQRQSQATEAARVTLQAQRDQVQAVKDFQTLNVQALTQSVALRQADAEQIKNAAAFIGVLQQQEQDVNRTLVERLAIHQQLVALQQALNAAALEALARQQQARTDALAITQQAIGGQNQQAQAALQLGQITREQFTEEQLRNTQRATAADVANLQAQRAANFQRPVTTEKEVLDLAAETDHLDQQIKLRQQLGELQLAAVKAEKEINDLLVLRQQQLLRIAAAGGGNQLGGAPARQDLPTVAPGAIPGAPPVPLILQGAATREAEGLAGAFGRATAAEKQMEAEARIIDNLLKEIGLKLKDIGNANISKFNLDPLFDEIQRVNGALADVGLLSQQAAQDLGDVASLGKSIASGDIAGIISGGIHIIADIAGPSEAERERNRILAENNALLERNNTELKVRQSGVGGLVSQGVTLASLTNDQALLNQVQASSVPLDAGRSKLQFLDAARDELAQKLAASGTNIRDFAAEVKAATGISILDEKGRLVAAAFDQARLAIDQMVKAALTLPTDIASQQKTLETQDTLGIGPRAGDSPNVQRIERAREIELNNLNLSAAEEAKIRSLDLSTAEGRKAFLEEQRALEKRIESGGISKEELGTFQSVQELQGVVNDAASGLSAFTDATVQATKALSNVPDLSTLAEQEFRARSAFSTGQGPNDGAQLPIIIGHPGLRGTDINPPIPAPGISESRVTLDGEKVADPITAALSRVGGGASLKDILDALTGAAPSQTAPTSAQGRLQQFFGEIKVMVQGAADPAATVDAIRTQLAGIRLAETGQEDAP